MQRRHSLTNLNPGCVRDPVSSYLWILTMRDNILPWFCFFYYFCWQIFQTDTLRNYLAHFFFLSSFQNSKFFPEKIDGRDSPKTRRFQFGKMLALFLPLSFLAHKRYQSNPAGSHFVCRPETQWIWLGFLFCRKCFTRLKSGNAEIHKPSTGTTGEHLSQTFAFSQLCS